MSKERGPYKKYNFDESVSMPSSTLRHKKRKLNNLEENECSLPPVNSVIQPVEDYVDSNISIFYQPEHPPVLNTLENEFNETDNVDEQTQKIQDCVDEVFMHFSEEEEIAAALLTIFYCGGLTQFCLAMVTRLFNILSKFKVPTTFDGLSNLLHKKSDKHEEYSKKWFCKICQVEVTIQDRFQRDCKTCLTK
jgi:hypothetical protein